MEFQYKVALVDSKITFLEKVGLKRSSLYAALLGSVVCFELVFDHISFRVLPSQRVFNIWNIISFICDGEITVMELLSILCKQLKQFVEGLGRTHSVLRAISERPAIAEGAKFNPFLSGFLSVLNPKLRDFEKLYFYIGVHSPTECVLADVSFCLFNEELSHPGLTVVCKSQYPQRAALPDAVPQKSLDDLVKSYM
jgi:hypothetical protein